MSLQNGLAGGSDQDFRSRQVGLGCLGRNDARWLPCSPPEATPAPSADRHVWKLPAPVSAISGTFSRSTVSGRSRWASRIVGTMRRLRWSSGGLRPARTALSSLPRSFLDMPWQGGVAYSKCRSRPRRRCRVSDSIRSDCSDMSPVMVHVEGKLKPKSAWRSSSFSLDARMSKPARRTARSPSPPDVNKLSAVRVMVRP